MEDRELLGEGTDEAHGETEVLKEAKEGGVGDTNLQPLEDANMKPGIDTCVEVLT